MTTCCADELNPHPAPAIPRTTGFARIVQRSIAGLPRLSLIGAQATAGRSGAHHTIQEISRAPQRYEDYERRGSSLGDLLGGQVYPRIPGRRNRF